MAVKAIFKCNQCGNEFTTEEGCLTLGVIFRCVDCDTIKWVEAINGNPTEEVGKCWRCGGEMKDGLKPMCPKCRSRRTREKEASVFYD